jgi:hypothetical protein
MRMTGTNGKIFLVASLSAAVSAAITWHVTRRYHDNRKPSNYQPGVVRPPESSERDHRLRMNSRGSYDPAQKSLPSDGKWTNPSNPLKASIAVAESSGDFASLASVFDTFSQNDRIGRFQEISSIFSKLGPKHDIAAKMAILEKVNAPDSTLDTFKRKILEAEARERYGELKDDGVLETLTDQEFGYVCRALTTSRIKQGFKCIDDGNSDSAKRTAAGMVTQYAIQAGTMEASKEIAALAPGIIRDEAVAELVLWLRRTGADTEAAPWLETIRDERAKIRALGK